MIRGLIALLNSGMLLNPMILLGIIGGAWIMHNFSEDEIMELFQNTDFYTGLFGVAFLFAFIFERAYFPDEKGIDWKSTLATACGRFITLLITLVFTCLFIFSFSFADVNLRGPEKAPEQTQETPASEPTEKIIFR